MIVVFGGTGTIGGEVLRALAAQGTPVTAAVRDRSRAASLPVPVPTVVADLADPASLSPAVRDADDVFVATPASERQVELETSLVDALAELQQLYRAHLAEVVTDEVQKGTGRPPATLDDWLTRNRAAFA